MVSTSISSETETANGRSFVASLYRVMHKGWTFRYRRRQIRHKGEWRMSAAVTMNVCFRAGPPSLKGFLHIHGRPRFAKQSNGEQEGRDCGHTSGLWCGKAAVPD